MVPRSIWLAEAHAQPGRRSSNPVVQPIVASTSAKPTTQTARRQPDLELHRQIHLGAQERGARGERRHVRGQRDPAECVNTGDGVRRSAQTNPIAAASATGSASVTGMQ